MQQEEKEELLLDKIQLTAGTTLYIVVGQYGENKAGNFNGGGYWRKHESRWTEQHILRYAREFYHP